MIYILKGNKCLFVRTEDYDNFNKILKEKYQEIVKDKMVSYKYFVNKVLDKMILGEINIFNEIKQEIDMLDIHKYVIIQPMYGIKLAKEKEINIAGYKFIQKEYIKEYLKEILEIPIEVMGPSIIEEAIYEPMCYVELSFNSKDKIKVEEEARKKYKELENIISFMCGDIDKKIGLCNI